MSILPLLSYRFGCNGDQQPALLDNDNNSTSQLVGSLQGLDQASCLFSSNGVRSSTPIVSNATIASLRNEFIQRNASGIVLETWITPSSLSTDTEESIPIVVIGNSDQATKDDATGCPGIELSIGIRGDVLEIQYSDNDEASSCRILVVRQHPLASEELTQVVVALNNDGYTNIYLNGNPVVQGAPNDIITNMSTWDPDSTLQLLTTDGNDSGAHFEGTLHLVSMYSQLVNNTQVAAMYNRGLQELTENPVNRRGPLRLVAHSEANPAIVLQGQSSSFRVGGLNASKPMDYTVMVEIMSLPQFGSLLSDAGPVFNPGQRLALTEDFESVPLFYRAWEKDYFNSPHLTHSGRALDTHPEFFSYRLIAVPIDEDSSDTLLGWSEPQRQELAVVHVNHPPSLVVPEVVHVPIEQPTGLGARPIALVQGIELKDPDWNIDRVRVDVWAKSGTLTVHQDVLPLADFDGCRQRSNRDWQCQGTGIANRNMTFVAEPDDVSQLLSSLEYTAFNWDQGDEITVRVYDGSGGPCLSEKDHQSGFFATENFFSEQSGTLYTIHEECFGIVTSIAVPEIRRNDDDSITGGKSFFKTLFEVDSFDAADIVFWSMVAGVLFFCCFMMQSCIRCRGARGAKIYPDDANFGRRGDGQV